jgi:hypothetical protein
MRAAVLAIPLLLAAAAQAQSPAPQPKQGFDCQRLPGGNAPVQRIAQLTTPLAVRSLELTYYGKRLADLAETDFDQLLLAYPMCNQTTDRNADTTMQRFRAVVQVAQRTRRDTADWIERMKFEAGGLAPTREGIIRLTTMWYEMEMKSPDLMPADSEDLATFLAARMNELYARAPVRRAGEDLKPTVKPPLVIEVGPAPTAVPAEPPRPAQ